MFFGQVIASILTAKTNPFFTVLCRHFKQKYPEYYIQPFKKSLSAFKYFSKNRPLGRFFLVVAISVYVRLCPLFT